MIIDEQDYSDLNEVANTLMCGLYATLAKMRDSGLTDCTEYDKGVTAIRAWEQYNKNGIIKLEAELKKLRGKD